MIATALGEEKPGTPESLGVVNVIRNRAIDGGYGGDTPTGVVTAPSQFSPWNDASGRARMQRAMQDPAAVAKVSDAIDQAYGTGKYVNTGPNDPTDGKTHFYDPASMIPAGSAPAWARGKETQRIGNTLFLDDPDEPQGGRERHGQAASGAGRLRLVRHHRREWRLSRLRRTERRLKRLQLRLLPRRAWQRS